VASNKRAYGATMQREAQMHQKRTVTSPAEQTC